MRTFRNATRELDNDMFGGDLWVHKPYKPNIRVQASRISKEEWQKHEARIRELHAEGCTSERARQILRTESQAANGCFNPSAAQYAAHLKALGLRTYNLKRRHGRPTERGFPDDLHGKTILSEESSVVGTDQHGKKGRNQLFKDPPRSIPEGQDLSYTSSGSAASSAAKPATVGWDETSSNHNHILGQMSTYPGCVDNTVSEDISPKGESRSSRRNVSSGPQFPTAHAPLLTFLRVVDPGFAYIPTSTVVRFLSRLIGPGNSSASASHILSEASNIADCLHAAQSYADAFDLYYTAFCYLSKTPGISNKGHLLTAALNCARSSSTDQQDQCAIAVLRLTLRDQERGAGDHISAGVLHLYLGELYQKQKNEKSECSTMTALQHLTIVNGKDPVGNDHHPTRSHVMTELDLPLSLHTSLIMQSKTLTPAYNRYFAAHCAISISTSQRFARDIKSTAVMRHLLKWCADAIVSKALYLNPLASILPGDSPSTKAAVGRLLFCCCYESWLKDAKNVRDVGKYFFDLESALKTSKMPWPESLSAISLVIVDEAFRESDPLAAIKKRFRIKTLASHLIRTIKAMLSRIDELEQCFTDKFLALLVAPGEHREVSQIDELSRRVLEVFAGKIFSSGMLREQEGSLSCDIASKMGSNVSLLPVAADLLDPVLGQSPGSKVLDTPRSSFSSGARPLQALHAELTQMVLSSLSTSKSKGSLTAAWSRSRRGSWSSEMVRARRR